MTNFQTVKHKQTEKESAQRCSLVALNSSKLYRVKPAQTPILLMLQCYIEGKGTLVLNMAICRKMGYQQKGKWIFK